MRGCKRCGHQHFTPGMSRGMLAGYDTSTCQRCGHWWTTFTPHKGYVGPLAEHEKLVWAEGQKGAYRPKGSKKNATE